MKISKHLNLLELTRSDSAKRNKIDNSPEIKHLQNLKKLAINIFEPIRNNFGVPIYISSGYRSKALNEFVNGSLTSQHSSGEAIDIDMDGSTKGVDNKMVFDFIKNNLDFDQLIYEFGNEKKPDWVHVSFKSSGKQRKEVLRAIKKGKKTIYKTYV